MSDEQQPQEPQAFRDFDDLYTKFVRCHWHDPPFKQLLQDFKAFLAKHPELYGNEFILPCIQNARGHCIAAGVPAGF